MQNDCVGIIRGVRLISYDSLMSCPRSPPSEGNRAAVLGDPCGQWAQAAIDARGPEALRSIMALCGLIKKHSGAALNAACDKALRSGSHRLKDIRRLIGEHAFQSSFAFAQSHPLIRDLKTYSDFINQPTQTPHDDHDNDPNPQTTRPEPASFRAA